MALGSKRQEFVHNLRRAFTPEIYEEEGSPHQSLDTHIQMLAKIILPFRAVIFEEPRTAAYYKEFHNSVNVLICKAHGMT